MRLAAKMLLLVLLGTTLVVAIHGYESLRQETDLLEQDMRDDAIHLGHVIAGLFDDAWQTGGKDQALAIVESANRGESALGVRFIEVGGPEDPSVPGGGMLETTRRARDEKGREVLLTYVPVETGTRHAGVIELAEPTAPVRARERALLWRLAILAGVMALLTGGLVVVLGYAFVGRPVARLVEKARRIGAGEPFEPAPARGRDEIALLSREIDGMHERLSRARRELEEESAARVEAMEQLRHADRLRTAGRLAAGLAHELGTPLNVVSGRAGLVASGRVAGEEIVTNAMIIKEQAERMAGIIRQFLDFARRRAPHRNEMDVTALVRQTIELLTPMARGREVRLEMPPRPEAGVRVRIDGGQIQQVLTNLVVNGVQASRPGGTVRVVAGIRQERPPGPDAPAPKECVCVDVIDEGEGIEPENLDHLFEPFFTTKDVGDGTGLGLSIVHGLVAEHGGWIRVDSRPGEGSRFTVCLPREEGHGLSHPDRG